MVRPAACLFDLDGLLLDTEPFHAHAWKEAARHFGLELADHQLRQLRGRRRHDCAAAVLGWLVDAGGPAIDATTLLGVRQPIAERLLASAPAMDGAPDLVRRCHQRGIPMALATSSSREAVDLKARPHPWLELIATRVHGDDPELAAGKPAPDVFLLAAARLGVPPGECWAFEDSPAGARAAVDAGCRVHVLLPEGVARSLYPQGVECLQSLQEVEL
ncbi:HAD family phosphatase [Cyanobium sp. FGCU-52]|nr:HAD family phosphatase [Cyanobium sp. FGCU52]